jgi:hypothetical protein
MKYSTPSIAQAELDRHGNIVIGTCHELEVGQIVQQMASDEESFMNGVLVIIGPATEDEFRRRYHENGFLDLCLRDGERFYFAVAE